MSANLFIIRRIKFQREKKKKDKFKQKVLNKREKFERNKHKKCQTKHFLSFWSRFHFFILRPCLVNHFTLQSYFRHLDFLSTALSKFRLGQCKYFPRLLLFPLFCLFAIRPNEQRLNKAIPLSQLSSYRLWYFQKTKSCWVFKISYSISCVLIHNKYNMSL